MYSWKKQYTQADLEHPWNEILPSSAVLQFAKAVLQNMAGGKQDLPQTALLAGGVSGGITLAALHNSEVTGPMLILWMLWQYLSTSAVDLLLTSCVNGAAL